MDIKIYQTYFREDQADILDPAFIPFENLKNENPELRELPLLKKLHEQNKTFDGYWGMVSWRWKEKTKLDGQTYIDWITENPGHDVYHVNHFPELPAVNLNSLTQGEKHIKGLLPYFERLVDLLGKKSEVNVHSKFPAELFICSHHYVGNKVFWDDLMSFMDHCLKISAEDDILNNFLFNRRSAHRHETIINYSFAVERLPVLFLHLNKQYKILPYPLQPPSPPRHVPYRLRPKN